MAVAKEDIGAELAMAGGAVGSPVRLRIACPLVLTLARGTTTTPWVEAATVGADRGERHGLSSHA
jgi:hypothetical protein